LQRAILVKLAGERVRSFAIITTTSNELCAELHNRIPAILGPDV
jgi:putative SOS response-associated peptidase YedK